MNGDSASSSVLSYVGKLGETNLDWTLQSVSTEVVLSLGILFAIYVLFYLYKYVYVRGWVMLQDLMKGHFGLA
jgi:hypothetical protein